jgi:DNA-binding PadR family transcriptional regulator
MAQKRDWLLGNIEPLLLYLIFEQPMYGYQIIRELETRSHGYFKFKEGTLYPVLHRLEKDGLIGGHWQTLDSGRQRKYYRITNKGRSALAEIRSQWREFLVAVDLVVQLPSA